MKRMETKGVQTLVHYPVPIHRQKGFPYQKEEAFPVSDEFAATIVSLPLYPELTDEKMAMVTEVFNECAR
jgi:dTDP-4-amino-4,6-dideoxygalactose transaminase